VGFTSVVMVEKRVAYAYDVGDARVTLTDTDFVAVDLDASRGLLDEDVVTALGRRAESLRGSLVLAKKDDLSAESLERLDRAGAAQPVLESADGTLLTVLPEVRVELESGDETSLRAEAAKVRDVVEELDAEVVRQDGTRVVIEPRSRRGRDALEVAQRLDEVLSGALSQPRFIRRMARPG
jgi:hypothetical protein